MTTLLSLTHEHLLFVDLFQLKWKIQSLYFHGSWRELQAMGCILATKSMNEILLGHFFLSVSQNWLNVEIYDGNQGRVTCVVVLSVFKSDLPSLLSHLYVVNNIFPPKLYSTDITIVLPL